MDNEIEALEHKQLFLNERNKIRYLGLRANIIKYSMLHCIGDYEKIGLTEAELDCIKNRTYTYTLAYKDFNKNQITNLESFFKKEDYI